MAHLQKTKSVRGCARKLQPDVRYADTLGMGTKTKTQRILKFDIELHIHCRSAQVKVLHHLNPNTTNIHHYKKIAEVQFAKHQKVLAKSKAPPTI